MSGDPMPDWVALWRRSRSGRAPIAPWSDCSAAHWSETLSVLHEPLWRGLVSPELADQARQRLRGADVARESPTRLLDEAWGAAQALGWAKTYDAQYVALARLRDCPLVTLDARLKRGAGRLITVLGPTELG